MHRWVVDRTVLYDMAGKELMYEDILHGRCLTISSGWMVILWDLVLITSTTRMVWKDIQSIPANGSRISFINKILYRACQKCFLWSNIISVTSTFCHLSSFQLYKWFSISQDEIGDWIAVPLSMLVFLQFYSNTKTMHILNPLQCIILFRKSKLTKDILILTA